MRLIKFWNAQHGKPLGSYHLETLCLDAFSWIFPESQLDALQHCLSHIATAVSWTCPDPQGYGPALDSNLQPAVRQRVSTLAQNASILMQHASLSASWNDHHSASLNCQQVFGPRFPVCP